MVIRTKPQGKKLFIGPFYASVDSFLVSDDALRKNLELGIKIARSFGQKDFIGYLSDTFGHSKNIFTILKEFDINYAIVWRGVPSNFPADFIANGVKTTRLCYGYYQDILHNTEISYDKKAQAVEKILDKINEKSGDTLLLPLGADHLAPPDNPVLQIKEINKRLKKYEIKLESPFEYLKKADFSKFEYEGEFLDNSETFILPGVYSTRIPMKAKNAELEWNLFHKAYKLNTLLKGNFKQELDFAAGELIKNHAHDSIYGCSIDEVNKMVEARQITVQDTADSVISGLIYDCGQKSAVFNLSEYEQTGIVRFLSDKKIKNAQVTGKKRTVSSDIFFNILKNPMTEDFHTFYEYIAEVKNLKPLSCSHFEISAPIKTHTLGDDFIENKYLKLFILNGEIYVLDKLSNRLYPSFIEINTILDNGDSYNYAPACMAAVLKLKKSKVKTNGSIKSTLRLTFEENIKLDISITNESKFFEIEANFINKKKNRKLQISFNTLEPVMETNADYSIKRAHDPCYSLFNAMPAPPKKELKTNSYPLKRFVCTNGIGIITMGLNEYEISQKSIKITLLRSIGIISNPENKARSVPAGPPIECPDMQCIGEHKMRLGFTFDIKNMQALADNFYDPFVVIH